MRRTVVVSLMVLLTALAWALNASAQTPAPTATQQPVPTFPTGSISGRIVIEGPGSFSVNLAVLPAGLPQPVTYGAALPYFHSTDLAGNFTVTGLEDGEYLIAVGNRGETFTSSLTESVTFIDVDTFSLPALRVTITGGEAVTGIVITLTYPPLQPIGDDFGTPMSAVADLPSTGAGAGSNSAPAGYIGAAVAGLAALALVGGVIWRLRGARS